MFIGTYDNRSEYLKKKYPLKEDKMKSTYTLVPGIGSRCPVCNTTPVLLCHKKNQTANPQFYICFFCNKVFQLGRGEVTTE